MFKLNILENTHIKTKNKNIVYCAYNTQNNKIYIGFTTIGLIKRKVIHICKATHINKTNNYFF